MRQVRAKIAEDSYWVNIECECGSGCQMNNSTDINQAEHRVPQRGTYVDLRCHCGKIYTLGSKNEGMFGFEVFERSK